MLFLSTLKIQRKSTKKNAKKLYIEKLKHSYNALKTYILLIDYVQGIHSLKSIAIFLICFLVYRERKIYF